jgi:hypothetical protein
MITTWQLRGDVRVPLKGVQSGLLERLRTSDPASIPNARRLRNVSKSNPRLRTRYAFVYTMP